MKASNPSKELESANQWENDEEIASGNKISIKCMITAITKTLVSTHYWHGDMKKAKWDSLVVTI